MAIVVRRCPLIDQPLISPWQRTQAVPGQPSHHLINQNRFFRHMLIIKEARDRCWPPLPPLANWPSVNHWQRTLGAARHGIIPSRHHTVDHAHHQKGAISSLMTYPPCYRQLTLHHLWLASLTCLFDHPPKRSQLINIYATIEGGRGARGHCVTMITDTRLC